MSPTNRAVWQRKWEGRREPVNNFARGLVKKLGEGKGRKLLDVGCGSGVDSLFLARHGYLVTGTDFSESGIGILNSKAKADDLNIKTLLHDTEKKFPFPDGSFDVVYAHLALHYFSHETTERVFAEMRRLLRPGGFFFVKCKSIDDPLYGKGKKIEDDMYQSDHTRHFFSRQYLSEMLKDFDIVSLRKSSSTYHGSTSSFVQAVATK